MKNVLASPCMGSGRGGCPRTRDGTPNRCPQRCRIFRGSREVQPGSRRALSAFIRAPSASSMTLRTTKTAFGKGKGCYALQTDSCMIYLRAGSAPCTSALRSRLRLFHLLLDHQMLRLGSAAKAGVRGCRQLSSKASPKYTPVLVDGVRIPFVTASSLYKDYMAVDLQKIAFNVSHMPVKWSCNDVASTRPTRYPKIARIRLERSAPRSTQVRIFVFPLA